ncbi:MAG: insulinase family protein, partial [Calditrichaeota bacterium]
ARPGEDLAKIEKAVDEELARFLAEGPTEKELARVKTRYRANFIRGIERIGGFGGKSDILAMNQVYGGRPDFYKTTLARIQNATAEDLRRAANTWLASGDLIVEVHPFPRYKTIKTDVDRSKLPDTGQPPKAKFPEMHRATLSNGLKIIVAERTSVPVVDFSLLVDAGYAADQFGLPGTASLALNMLDEGTKSRTALQISEELAMLGASLSTGSNLDMSFVDLSALKSKLDEALDLYADVILHPSFPEADFNRLKKQQLARIKREKSNPIQMALRVFPKLIYGADHAYGLPFTGSGYEESVAKLTRTDLVNFHKTWFKPNNATLVVVGATTLEEIRPKLEKLFKEWKRGDVPKKNIATVGYPAKPVVYLMDKPGAQQSIIFAGHVAPPMANPHELAIETLNSVLGGQFTSRLNMNLREDKHWSYGSGSFVVGARGQRPFIAYAPVQTDKTKESLVEVEKELNGIVATKPVTSEELTKVQQNRILRLPGLWETMASVRNSINEMVRYGLPDNYYDTYADRIKSLSLDEVQAAAKELVHPKNLIWVVVGDRAKIESGVRELNLGEVRFIDSDGNPIE